MVEQSGWTPREALGMDLPVEAHPRPSLRKTRCASSMPPSRHKKGTL